MKQRKEVALRVRGSTLIVALTISAFGLAACGGDNKEKAASAPASPASQLAPEKPGTGVVKTRLPAYAGDPRATRRPTSQDVLDRLPKVTPPKRGGPVPNIKGSAGTTVAQWLNIVDNDVASFWQARFNQAGMQYGAARQAIFAQPVTTPCGRALVRGGPFYCSAEATIYLPLPWFVKNANPQGDTAIAVVVAHENGHHIQNLMHVFANRRSIDLELQADCLAGYWAASVYQRGLIEPGDINEAVTMTSAAGDAPGTPVNAPGAHGSARQRVAAFLSGYDSGRAGDCKI